MNLLGRCYQELGMLDLAMKQFEEASKEILTMDAMKKEIVRTLSVMGTDESTDYMMELLKE